MQVHGTLPRVSRISNPLTWVTHVQPGGRTGRVRAGETLAWGRSLGFHNRCGGLNRDKQPETVHQGVTLLERLKHMSWLWTFGTVPELNVDEVQQFCQQLHQLTAEERSKPSAPQIIDVRTQAEYEGGCIQGAKNASFLPPWSFHERVTPLLQTSSKDAPLLLICLSAHRSIGALKWLRKEGYTNVHQLAGGMQAWRAKGAPEVVPSKSDM